MTTTTITGAREALAELSALATYADYALADGVLADDRMDALVVDVMRAVRAAYTAGAPIRAIADAAGLDRAVVLATLIAA